jgi:chromosome segregation ATPase
MRRILSWAAAAAILAVPASGWCQQADSKDGQQDQAQAPASTTPAPAQVPAPQQESLADAARKARDAKKDAPKTTKVFDNDNLPATGGISTVGKASEPKDGAAADAAPSAAGEKAWRDRFASLRAKLARDKSDLEVMQRELGVLNLQNYSDPVKAMQQDLTRSDINKKTADIDAKQKTIEADQQAISDAEEELRKSGGDSGWAR